MSSGASNQPSDQSSTSKERNLPPIREVFGAELSSVHSYSADYYHGHGNPREEPQPQHRNYSSANTSSSQFSSNTSMLERTHFLQDRIAGSSTRNTSGGSIPAFTSNSGGGYSYGVLRTSGPSGTLTDAIPPSAHPQGIIRQTSYLNAPDQDDPNKRFMCEYCGKRFGMPSHLQIHLRTHTADRPFQCTWPECNKSFTTKSNLTRHLKAHEK